MRSANFTCKSTKLSIGIEHRELNIWQNYKKNMRYQVYGRYTSEIYGQRVEESADHLTRSTPARKPLLDPVRSSLFRDTMDRGTEAGCDTAEGRRNTVFCVTNCALSPPLVTLRWTCVLFRPIVARVIKIFEPMNIRGSNDRGCALRGSASFVVKEGRIPRFLV